MTHMNTSAIIVAQAMAEQSAHKKYQKHIKRALEELKRASRYGRLELTFTEEQLRQIDAARARGDKITVSIDFS